MLQNLSLKRRRQSWRPCLERLECREVPAIGFVQQIASATPALGATTVTLTNAQSEVATGHSVIVVLTTAGDPNFDPPDVTDSAGNFYEPVQGLIPADPSDPDTFIYLAQIYHALPVNGSITVTYGADEAGRQSVVTATDFAGLLVVDQVASDAKPTDAAPASGPATVPAGELVFGAIGAAKTANPAPAAAAFTPTPGTTFTPLTQRTSTTGNQTLDLLGEFQLAPATGSVNISGTFADTRNWTSLLASFREVGQLTAITITQTVVQNSSGNVFNLVAGNTDPSGRTLSLLGTAGQNQGGTIALLGNGRVAYTPRTNFAGTEFFGYKIASPTGATSIGTVQVNVTPLPLTTVADAVIAPADTPNAPVDVLANDVDPTGGKLLVISVSKPAHGTAVPVLGGLGIFYTPDKGFFGTDTFTYVAQSENGGSGGNSVTVTVTPTLALDTPGRVFGRKAAVAFSKVKFRVHYTDPRVKITLLIRAAPGKMVLPRVLPGVKIKENKAGDSLTLIGTQDAINKALTRLVLKVNKSGRNGLVLATAKVPGDLKETFFAFRS